MNGTGHKFLNVIGGGAPRLPTRGWPVAGTLSVVLLTLGLSGCTWLGRAFGPPSDTTRERYTALFRGHRYDVAPNAPLIPTFEAMGRAAGVTFEWEPKLRRVIDELDPRLSGLRSLRVDELLQLLPETVPPASLFEYDYLPNQTVRVRLHALAVEP